MQKALSNATEFSGIQRVFQRLPRYMRRRAASHNSKRVPEKKRQLAIAQMLRDPTPVKPKTRKAKRKPGNIVAHFANRKIDKQWLETHIWHAKRFRMENMWGYRIPMKPNEHSVKSAYRAAKHQAVMYDVSYMQCVEIIGIEEDDFRIFFEQCFDASVNVLGKRYTNGASQGHTYVYQQKKYPLEVISPVSFFWKQEELCEDLQTSKTLWVWIHPGINQ
jgi:ribonuclease P/MRP protein subunit POP1